MSTKKKSSVVKNVAFYAFLLFVAVFIWQMHEHGANPWEIFVGK